MKVSVLKFNPAADGQPYYVDGEVEYTENMTALHALKLFNENVQHVNYEYNCRARLCGRCAMMINDEPAMACTYVLPDDGDLVFEPLAGFPVICDLVVDKHPMDNVLTEIYQRVHREPFTRETMKADPAQFTEEVKWETYGMEFCSRCGSCVAGCPARAAHPDSYIGPAGLLAIGYRFNDPLDEADRVMQAVSEGMYYCIMCGKCDEVCPHDDINHLSIWKRLRAEAEKRDIVPSYAK